MWPLAKIKTATSPRSRSFTSISFKDIQSLCKEDPPQPQPRSPSVFHRIRISSAFHTCRAALLTGSLPSPLSSSAKLSRSPADKPVTVYFTSLRVVRKTFEDCRAVQSILRGFRVPVEERDLSMDSRFVSELQGILGRKIFSLPCVFIGGRYVGGAEEVRKLDESGELRTLIKGLPTGGHAECGLCGDLRYVVCEQCDGSHKVYAEKTGFRSCVACNVNGLTRCPGCVVL